jgi:hypothetical protein
MATGAASCCTQSVVAGGKTDRVGHDVIGLSFSGRKHSVLIFSLGLGRVDRLRQRQRAEYFASGKFAAVDLSFVFSVLVLRRRLDHDVLRRDVDGNVLGVHATQGRGAMR